jgi:hypothetical protein
MPMQDMGLFLTTDDIQSLRSDGYDSISSNLAPSVFPEWGMWEAIRDLVQNALDETESFDISQDEEGTIISDPGEGFNVKAFLLGQDKPKRDDQRGKFGTGLKIALLAILREGFPVSFETKGLEGFAAFETRTIQGEKVETFVLLVKGGGTREGSRFKLWGYHGTTYMDNFATTLQSTEDIPSMKFTGEKLQYNTASWGIKRWDQIFAGNTGLGPTTPEGRLYGRDIFMKDVNSDLSYNLWGFNMAHDRHDAASTWQLNEAIAEAWSGVTDIGLLRYFLEANTKGSAKRTGWGRQRFEAQAEWYSHSIDRMKANKGLWLSAWNQQFGSNTAMNTNPTLIGQLQHINIETIELENSGFVSALKQVIPKSAEDVLKAFGVSLEKVIEIVPDRNLPPQASIHMSALILLQRAMPVSKFGTQRDQAGDGELPDILAAKLPPDVIGLYESKKNRILLRTDVMNFFSRALDVWIHEYAHYYTGAGDGSEAHTRAISTIGSLVAQTLIAREVDARFYKYTLEWN